LIDFQCEQVYFNIENRDSVEQNIYNTISLTSPVLRSVYEDLKQQNIDTFDTIIIDLSSLQNAHNLDFVFETFFNFFFDKNKDIFITNVSSTLYENLKLGKIESKIFRKEVVNKESILHFSLNKNTSILLSEISSYKSIIFQSLFEDKMNSESSYYGDKEEKLSYSSDVYLDKYINVKAFIEDKPFSHFGLFLLAQKVKELFIKEEKNQYLFTMSINGSYIASILSKLLGVEVSYLDHLGPINKMYKTKLDNRILTGKHYFLVSDVICLGTETKKAESIIQYENAFVDGYITVVNIKTVTRPNNKPTNFLFEINKDNNYIFKYAIRTELDLI
jgi:hypothetical protein